MRRGSMRGDQSLKFIILFSVMAVVSLLIRQILRHHPPHLQVDKTLDELCKSRSRVKSFASSSNELSKRAQHPIKELS